MKLGARMLKTGLAVTVALYVAAIFGLPAPVFAGIAAVFSIQPSIYRSYQHVIEQIQANILGAISAIIMVFLLGNDPFIIGFTIIIVIGACMQFKIQDSTLSIAIVSVIAIMETTSVPFFEFAFMRFSTMMVGIFAAFFVNLIFLPPKYETKLFNKLDNITGDILKWLRVTTRHLSDHPALKIELQRIQDDITRLDQTYLFFSEERTYSRKRQFEKARKLVLFRQFIATMKKAFDLLKTFYQLDHEMTIIPQEFRTQLVEELDKVIHSHEKLLLMSMGRIRQENEAFDYVEEPNIPKLIETLIRINNEKTDENEKLMFLPLATKLMDYHMQLKHAKRLLISYQHYHQTETLKIKLEED